MKEKEMQEKTLASLEAKSDKSQIKREREFVEETALVLQSTLNKLTENYKTLKTTMVI